MTQLPIGALVTNFGVIAKVVGHHAFTGDPVSVKLKVQEKGTKNTALTIDKSSQ